MVGAKDGDKVVPKNKFYANIKQFVFQIFLLTDIASDTHYIISSNSTTTGDNTQNSTI